MASIQESLGSKMTGVPMIDARAPRFNQAVIGVVALAGGVLHSWPLSSLAAVQLALVLLFGPRVCLGCAVYFRLIRPRFGSGPVEDARPVRFANAIGLLFLTGAVAAHLAGLHGLERGLSLTVATLALVAASTGICVGCQLYRLLATLRGIRLRKLGRIDLDEVGAVANSRVVVQFTHPRCTDCQELEERLRRQGVPLALVDVSKRPDLARKYGISLVPLAFKVAPDGRVLARVRG
jgi:hypothetical protein